jgi:tight adherence protein B
MSLLLMAIACATAGAVFCFAWSLQTSLSATGRAVRSRTLPFAMPSESETAPARRRWQKVMPLTGNAQKTTFELQQAGWLITVNEFNLLRTLFFVLFTLGGFLLLRQVLSTGPLLTALVLLICGFVGSRLPSWYLHRRRAARKAAVEKDLPEFLTSMAKSLRAGAGLLQAISFASAEAPAPLGPEVNKTLRDLQLGVAPEAAFEDLRQRVGSNDLDIAVTAMMIQRTVGGNLSEILTNVANTIRERQAIKAEVRVLTARQKLTANLVALLPVLLAFFYLGVNREVGELLFTTTTGNISLAVGIFFEVLGLFVIRQLAEIEY